MKNITSIILILFLSLISFPSWSETLTMDDLVKRNDLYYKKFTNVPFSGIIKRKGDRSLYELSDHIIETFENGKKTGPFQTYYNTGELLVSGNYKDGKKYGPYEIYYNENGQLYVLKHFKDGKEDGSYEMYYENGQLWLKSNYKDGKEEGLWEEYHENGQLSSKGNNINGKQEGLWEYFNEDGSILGSETFKNGQVVERNMVKE